MRARRKRPRHVQSHGVTDWIKKAVKPCESKLASVVGLDDVGVLDCSALASTTEWLEQLAKPALDIVKAPDTIDFSEVAAPPPPPATALTNPCKFGGSLPSGTFARLFLSVLLCLLINTSMVQLSGNFPVEHVLVCVLREHGFDYLLGLSNCEFTFSIEFVLDRIPVNAK